MKRTLSMAGLAMTLAIAGLAQGPGAPPPPAPPAPGHPDGPHGSGPHGFGNVPPPPPLPNRPPLRHGLQAGPRGRWWDNPEMAQRLSLNSDQQKKMDDIFQQNRLTLIDLNATLQKETITLDPLISSDSPEESKILAQIDRVAQARAALEKANARFLLGIRRALTQDQWKKLQAEDSAPRFFPDGPGRLGGPGGPH